MRKGSAPIIIIALITIFLLGIGATAAYFKLYQKPTPLPQSSPDALSEIQSPQPTTTPNDTANWKTYTNNKYKYSLKYPTNWNIEDNGNQVTITNGELRFDINPIPQGRGTYFTQTKVSTVTISGIQGKRTNFYTDTNQIFFSTLNLETYTKNSWNSGSIILD